MLTVFMQMKEKEQKLRHTKDNIRWLTRNSGTAYKRGDRNDKDETGNSEAI